MVKLGNVHTVLVLCLNWSCLCFISPVKGGVDAKELFHLYILRWIEDKRLSLLETCKLDKVHIQQNLVSFSSLIYQEVMDKQSIEEVVFAPYNPLISSSMRYVDVVFLNMVNIINLSLSKGNPLYYILDTIVAQR